MSSADNMDVGAHSKARPRVTDLRSAASARAGRSLRRGERPILHYAPAKRRLLASALRPADPPAGRALDVDDELLAFWLYTSDPNPDESRTSSPDVDDLRALLAGARV